MKLPQNIISVLDRLEHAGYEAYIVGGCVRDQLMGVAPHDFDVTTSALPKETKQVFSDMRIVETGAKHGTITVLFDGEPIEITTYRVDGEYADGRHPDQVRFTRSLKEDVSRRDFTMNGIAYSPKRGLFDELGGSEDIRCGVIRCIGEPDKRFNEDALRILRALRFAAVLGFSIEEGTAASIRRNAALLEKVSAERIFSELVRLLCGKAAGGVLRAYPEVFTFIIPELAPCVGYDQNSKYHSLTLYEHLAAAVQAAAPIPELKMAMLLHDIGKPLVRTVDAQGEAHYYGHAKESRVMAEEILRRSKSSNAFRERVCNIVKYHDMNISLNDRQIKRQLAKHGEEGLRDIMLAHIADDSAKIPDTKKRIPVWEEIMRRAKELSEQQPCLTVKTLAVNGHDMLQMIPPSPLISETLKYLLEKVIDGELENERSILLAEAQKYIAKNGKK